VKFVAKAQESRERDANMMMRGFVKIQTAKVLCLRLQCLERIRADVLKFTTGTEGKVNRMRLIDADKINFEEVFGGQSDFAKDIRESAQNLIDRQPTAFDKEKVIDQLKEEGCIIDDEAGNRAVEIVEKGGIE
jgi:hypothetical protein